MARPGVIPRFSMNASRLLPYTDCREFHLFLIGSPFCSGHLSQLELKRRPSDVLLEVRRIRLQSEAFTLYLLCFLQSGI